METIRWRSREEDWEVVRSFLPEGWEKRARAFGALRRCRGFEGPEALLRTLLVHLADGCSLRETAVRAQEGQLATVSDVALLRRLKASGEWLRWMACELMQTWVERQPAEVFGKGLNVRLVDGTTVQEPGATGSTWRIHYSVALPMLACDEVHLTSPKVGESFQRFVVQPGDLLVGDRGFAHREGCAHVVGAGGEVLVRINLTNLPLERRNGAALPLLQRLRSLSGTRLGDWEAWITHEGGRMAGRLCALKKSELLAERARRRLLKEATKKSRQVQPETLEAAGYVFVFTTLAPRFGPAAVLEIYRGRWQIELAFKRLKSLMGLGHLKKTDPQAAMAWIHGKLLVAFLIEAMIAAGERFFPWGYPLAIPRGSLPLEGDLTHASPAL
jgi:Transposase DDE domain